MRLRDPRRPSLRRSKDALAEASPTPASTTPPRPLSAAERLSAPRPMSPQTEAPRRFARVPTHAIGIHPEQREYPRATLKLPLKLRRVDNVLEKFPVTLVTRDISSTGVYFLCPKLLALGASLELEIVLVSRPLGRGNVVLTTRACVQRFEHSAMPGWFGIAASFDDVEFDRDDRVPGRFLMP
jgi:hypothetical protein